MSSIYLLRIFSTASFFAFRQFSAIPLFACGCGCCCCRCGCCSRRRRCYGSASILGRNQGCVGTCRSARHLIWCCRNVIGVRLAQQVRRRNLWIARVQYICKTTASKWSIRRVTGDNDRRSSHTTRIKYCRNLVVARHFYFLSSLCSMKYIVLINTVLCSVSNAI